MTKYHINAKGVPSVCRATKKPCPFGGADGKQNHFDSEEAAQAHANKMNEEQFGTPGLQSDAQMMNTLSPREREQKEYEQFLEKEFAPAVNKLVEKTREGPIAELYYDHGVQFTSNDLEDMVENPELYYRSMHTEVAIEYNEYGEESYEGLTYSKEEKLQAAAEFDDVLYETTKSLQKLDKRFMKPEKLAEVYNEMLIINKQMDYSEFKFAEPEPEPEPAKEHPYDRAKREEVEWKGKFEKVGMKDDFEKLNITDRNQVLKMLSNNDEQIVGFEVEEVKTGRRKQQNLYSVVKNKKDGSERREFQSYGSTPGVIEKQAADLGAFFKKFNKNF